MKKFLYFLLFLPLIMEGQTAHEGSTYINIITDGYSLRVAKQPLSLELFKGERLIAATSVNPVSFVSGSGQFNSLKIADWKLMGKVLLLDAETNLPGVNIEMQVMLNNQEAELVCKLPEKVDARDLTLSFELLPGKHWYGGPVVAGHNWPLETGEIVFDPMLAHSNQATPFWLTASGVGYFMPTYENMGFRLNDRKNGKFELFLKESRTLRLRLFVGEDIRETYRIFARSAGLPETVPPKAFFARPQFNTWIEYLKDIDQPKLLEYARKIRSEDFPCEVLMVDAGWAPIHGDYDFDRNKFPDPKAMIREIHDMGFKLMLWISPYVRKGSPWFDFLDRNGYLIKDAGGVKSGEIRWWGGTDYQIDMSHPEAFDWFVGQMRRLQRQYGVDGYKQDGGDARYIPADYKTFTGASPNRSADYWAKLGEYFEYNEYRVSWLMQSSGLVQRLRDKHNNWSADTGLGSLVPHGLTNSLIGYSYFCPDMIGGGDSKDFRDPNYKGMGAEMFVRWTQASALMPMMQFSYAPWNLDDQSKDICLKYAKLHEQFGGYIYELALNTTKTGDPIARPLFYNYPSDEQSFLISDQFMLGDRLLVAPVVTQGQTARNIYLPPGLWKDFWSGQLFNGGVTLQGFPADIDYLPLFLKISN